MKLIIKSITFIAIILASIFLAIYLVNINIITDEINRASYIAMNNVQDDVIKLMQNKMKNGVEYTYDYDEKYKEYFGNIVSKPDIYEIETYSNDQFGVIGVNIKSPYRLVRDKSLVNIIDRVEVERLVEAKAKLPAKIYNPLIDQVLYTWTLPSPKELLSWHIDVLATRPDSAAGVKKYKPNMELICVNGDEEEIIDIFTAVNNMTGGLEKVMEGRIEEGITCTCEKVKVFSYAAPYVRLNKLVPSGSYITFQTIEVDVELSSRFIDERLANLSDSSFWLKDLNYKSELERVMDRVYERHN